MKFIVSFLFISNISTADCLKTIQVESFNQKAFPSLFDLSQKTYDHKIKKILISCKLYDSIEVGDILVEENIELNGRDNFFNSFVEERKYKVLDKKQN